MQFSPLVVFLLAVFQVTQATIFITTPLTNTICHGGQPCLVQWVDNGETPLLSNIGPCDVGLYNGHGVLIQQIDPVDVSAIHSLQFTVDPASGPNSDTYYMNFTSINPIGQNSTHYTQYSPFFTLTDMSGSFSSPVPSDTSSISVPSSVASATTNSITTTFTISNSSSSTAHPPTGSLSPVSGSSVVSTSPLSTNVGNSPTTSLSSSSTTSVSSISNSTPTSVPSSSSGAASIGLSTSLTPLSSTSTQPSMITSRIPSSSSLPSSPSSVSPSSSSGLLGIRRLSTPLITLIALAPAVFMLS